MKKLPFVLLALVVALVACGAPPPQVQVVEVTRIVIPTERPTPRPSPTPDVFALGRDWTHSPEYNSECNYECETWTFYDGELIAQVYSDGIAFGLFMVGAGDAYEEGAAMRQAAISYGVPASVVSQAGEDIAAESLGFRNFGAWGYDLTLDGDLLIVSFIHDGPVNSRLG